jgi:hypothetical protein
MISAIKVFTTYKVDILGFSTNKVFTTNKVDFLEGFEPIKFIYQ